ncbi:FAD-dependent oxidoreductase [Streptomyces sp. NPDC001984]|uniref:FAD-dependent oxidoreductase n=1 Tax=Streptomyces sp. NPDC002619 TaxID=3364655 RepID=UPI0036B2FCB9
MVTMVDPHSPAVQMKADVLVLGAGLAGMSAAVTAAEAGAKTVLIERAPMIGGSAAMSGGNVWALPSVADLHAADPGEFQRHGHLVIENYPDTIRWLSQYSDPIPNEQAALDGRRFDMPVVFSQLHCRFVALGGRLHRDTEVLEVSRTSSGFSFTISTGGNRSAITARSVVLASGGRQADPAVRSALVDHAFVPPLRGNPYSRGDGARIATELGGSVNTANHGFYGHLYPADVDAVCPADFLTLAQYHSGSGILVGRDGQQFTDESLGDFVNAITLAEVGGRGTLLWTQATHAEIMKTAPVPGVPTIDRFDFARSRGARTAVASDVNDASAIAASWGSAPLHLSADATSQLSSGGDIYMVEVVPAVTFTFGGVEVNESGCATDPDGNAIPGLFAAGADMSDAYHRGYGGGLSLAVATGRRAGRLASRHATEMPPA